MRQGLPLRTRFRVQVLLIVALLMVGADARGLTLDIVDFTCPVCETEFEYQIAMSGTAFGRRLDLKRIGPIMSPWPMPQCPDCGLVLFKDEFGEDELADLIPYVRSDEYQSISRENTPYYFFAHILEHFGSSPIDVGFVMLQASWQADDLQNHEQLLAYLRESLGQFAVFLEESSAEEPTYLTVQLLCGEIERRLSRFAAARERYSSLLAGKTVIDADISRIIEYQIELIDAEDSEPHLMP